ncbi:MAG: glycosyltransferase family 9 protein [Candidatus Sulfotelmatobacter sp.]
MSEIVPADRVERLLVVRLSAMGDVIHTLPAVRFLRQAFPKAHIGWLIEERWAEILCAPGFSRRGARSAMRPLVDEVHVVNLKSWRQSLASISSLRHIATLWNNVRSVHHDVAIDLQGAMRSALLARLSGARVVLGAAEPRESPASLWYTRKVVARGRHVVEQNLSVAEALVEHSTEFQRIDVSDGFPRVPQIEASVDERLAQYGVRDFVILNPGAGWGAKRWPAERYGDVAVRLANLGVRSIINYGPGEEEMARVTEIASLGTAQAMNCTISELIALTRRTRLFIGGDTGPLHLAAALRVPVVAIYGPTDPARNGPYGTRSIVLRSPESVTSHVRRAAADEGMLGISSDEVVAAANKLLGGGLRG